MKKYYYRNKGGELAWHDEPAPRARLRTLTNTFIEHATLKASDTPASTPSDTLIAPLNAFKMHRETHSVSAGNLRDLQRRLVALSSVSRVAFSTCLKAQL